MRTYTVTISIPNDYDSEADLAAMIASVYGADYDPEDQGDLRDCYDALAEAARAAGLAYVGDSGFGAEWQGTAAQIRAALRNAPRWAYFGTPAAKDGDELDLRPAPSHPWAPADQGPALRALMQRCGLTGAAAGDLIGVDGRTIRRWLADPGAPGFRPMPYAAWYTLRMKAEGEEA
jgi:hypothetical protein